MKFDTKITEELVVIMGLIRILLKNKAKSFRKMKIYVLSFYLN